MDFEHRRVRWYWVTLFLIYCGVSVYGLLSKNPYLYSHNELKKEIQAEPDQKAEPVPSVANQLPLPASLGEQTYWYRLNVERNAMAPADPPWSEIFNEKEVFPLVSTEDFRPACWAIDGDGVFIGGANAAAGFALDGRKMWEYHFPEASKKPLTDALVDRVMAYLIHPTGEIVAVNKKNGELQWSIRLREEVVGPTFLSKDKIFIPVKSRIESKTPRAAFRWVILKKTTGEISSFSKPVEAKPDFSITFSPELNNWFLVSENKITAIDGEKLEPLWTQTLTDPIRPPASLSGHFIYLATLGGKVLKLDGSKKGRTEWEVDLEKPLVSAPTLMPVTNKISVMDNMGQLQLIDGKLGKALWHFNIENKNELKETWSARMKGSVIQKMQMDWAQKGWAIWAPCSKNRFCVYNPSKGQLISRANLAGSVLSFPIEKDKSLYFLVNQGKNWALSHVESEKTKASAADN
jgi:hypothetical protein